MNYLLPTGAKKYLQDIDININIDDRKANVPGTGNQPIAMTMAEDIGKAVVWLIDDAKPWPKYTYIKGSVTSWNELIKYGEEVTGEKFDVTYVPLETLEVNYNAAVAIGDPFKTFFAEIGVMYATDGALDLSKNEDPSLFEGIRFTQVKELIDNTYKK
jgi:nucleoside-diphosphate-sugar epimerase